MVAKESCDPKVPRQHAEKRPKPNGYVTVTVLRAGEIRAESHPVYNILSKLFPATLSSQPAAISIAAG
ncbi:hypothetical protein [Burkholderia cepacia]|uniref:hypothetical protein n=1 Tax=Burkholderia cepacia TaxID=292 RepID=UPI001F25DDEE|nr:hypothetical protein [Burkholderia cepacia]MCE4124480.1 hypothetical protein [Burkholderia cepacia]